jgi:hypothetical protein
VLFENPLHGMRVLWILVVVVVDVNVYWKKGEGRGAACTLIMAGRSEALTLFSREDT